MVPNSSRPGLSSSYHSAAPVGGIVTKTSTTTTTTTTPTTRDGRRVTKRLEELRKKNLTAHNKNPRYVAISDTSPPHSSDSSDDDFPGTAFYPKCKATAYPHIPSRSKPSISRTGTDSPCSQQEQVAPKPSSPMATRQRQTATQDMGTQTASPPELSESNRRYSEEQLRRYWRKAQYSLSRIIHLKRQVNTLQDQLETQEHALKQSRYKQYAVSDAEQENLFFQLASQLICDDSDNFAETMVFSPCDHAANGVSWTIGYPRCEQCQFPECREIVPKAADPKNRRTVIRDIVMLALSRQTDLFNAPRQTDPIQKYCDTLYSFTRPLIDSGASWAERRQKCTKIIREAVTEASEELNTRIWLLLDQDH